MYNIGSNFSHRVRPRPATVLGHSKLRLQTNRKILVWRTKMKTTWNNLRKRKLGVVGTAILMGLLLALLAWPHSDASSVFDIRNLFSYVFSGRLFAFQWDTTSPAYPFDHPNPGMGYLVFAQAAVIVLAYVALVRKISARRTRLEYWTFVIPTAFVCLLLICIVTIPFCYTIKWIDAAGRTSGRTIFRPASHGRYLWRTSNHACATSS